VVTGLLSLPIATTSGEHADFLDAPFTATPAAALEAVLRPGFFVYRKYPSYLLSIYKNDSI